MTTAFLQNFRTSFVVGALLFAFNTIHAQSPSHNHTPKPGASSLVKRSANEVLDGYLGQILCSNKNFKLTSENYKLAMSAKMSPKEINTAFSSKIFYSLKPGEEGKGSEHLKNTYKSVSKILENLRTMTLFFGHDIHDFLAEENSARKSRGEQPLTMSDFIEKFDSGAIKLTSDNVNFKELIDERINELVSLTENLGYGCEGNQNFIHRQGSELAKSVRDSAFLIPANPEALKLAERVASYTTKPNESERATASVNHNNTSNNSLSLSSSTATARLAQYNNFLKQGVPQKALDEATAKFLEFRKKGSVNNSKHLVVVDYTSKSSEPRFWVLNLQTGNATGMKMGHGDGSGLYTQPKDRTAFVSNVMSSEASTYGAMIIGGPKNNSQRPDATYVFGLEPHNKNAADRDILIHTGRNSRGVTYVTDRPGESAGRSQGCFAVSEANAKWIKNNLPHGTFLYAYKGNIPVVKDREEAKRAVARLR